MGNLKEFVENCVENYRSAGESSTKGQTEVILEKFAEHMDNEGVGSADWNTLKNRPFYEDNVFDLTWDGTTTIRDVTVNSGMYHLVSESVPNINSLANSEIYLTSGSETKK